MKQAAERIKKVREMFHMNRSEFADSLGISVTLISQMESDKVGISWKTSRLLEEHYCIRPDWLVRGEGNIFVREDITVESILDDHPALKKLFDIKERKRKAADEKIRNRAALAEHRAKLRKEAAERIAKFRMAYQINQNQLAKRLGYTRAYISAVEKGIQMPSKQMTDLIEAEFGVSSTWLLHGKAA